MSVGRPIRGTAYSHAYFLDGALGALCRGDIARAQKWLDASFELSADWGSSYYGSPEIELRARTMRIALHTLIMDARMERLEREGALIELHATRTWPSTRKAV